MIKKKLKAFREKKDTLGTKEKGQGQETSTFFIGNKIGKKVLE